MKKLAILFALLFVSIYCHAQNADLKHYFDYVQGFDGWAMAEYIDNIKKDDVLGHENEIIDFIDKEISLKLTPISKLTKNNTWLFKKALNEWDYEPGEVYTVFCAESQYANDGILIFAVIKNKNDYLWRAYSIKESDLDDFFN